MKPLILTRQPGSKSQPVVRKAVNQLRRECIQRDPGTLLGQEEELLRRLGISRPTLRQAAALLGQEQLMNVRRGPGGGYFTSRPDISAVVHMAAIWLQLEHVAIGEILASTSTLRRELAPLAALNMDEEGYAELAAFLEHDRAIDEKDYGFTVFLKAELQQNNIIGRLSRNRVLYLYLRISLDLVASLSPVDDILLGQRSRYLDFRHQRNRMIDAVLARDPDIAQLEADRCGDKIRKWMDIDARKKNAAGKRTAATRVDGVAAA